MGTLREFAGLPLVPVDMATPTSHALIEATAASKNLTGPLPARVSGGDRGRGLL